MDKVVMAVRILENATAFPAFKDTYENIKHRSQKGKKELRVLTLPFVFHLWFFRSFHNTHKLLAC
jgi:hypothetical protein